MKAVVVMDSLKGSLSSMEAGEAAKAGILAANPEATVIVKPLADGGEGTTEALVCGLNGRLKTIQVTGPIYEPVIAQYGIIDEVAVIEMAQAAGLPQVPTEKRNPLVTTTYGVGEMIKACVESGCKKFIIGIGGSATNDAGIGMLMALGYKFLDANGQEVVQGGQGLSQIVSIDASDVLPGLSSCEFKIACDVTNPLYGEQGAAYIYAPQKGATPEIVKTLDDGLRHFARVVEGDQKADFANLPGAGAAGGLGAGLMAFLDGNLKKGIEMVIEYAGLEEKVKAADMVWTGEGSIDFQTQYGKTPLGVATVAKKYDKPVIAFAGRVGEDIDILYEKGIDSIFGIMKEVTSIDEALKHGKKNIEKTAENVIRLIRLI